MVSNEEFVGAKTAICLCAALLLGFAVIVGASIHDKSRLASLERFEEPTAVGDRAFFSKPTKIESGKVAASFKGQSFAVVRKINARDDTMLKAGLDDSKSFFIYRAEEPKDDEMDFYFLKTADGEYLKIKPAAK